MKLNEILSAGVVSYIGEEIGDITVRAFKSESEADEAFNELEEHYQGSDAGVLRDTTMNGYHIVADMDWKAMDAFEGANFVAFAPTANSCKKLTERFIKEYSIEAGPDDIHYLEAN